MECETCGNEKVVVCLDCEVHAAVMADKAVEIASLRKWVEDAESRASRLTATLNDLAIAHGRLLLEKARWVLSDKPATPKVADATPDVAAPQPAPSGLRWGVRHKATGGIVARFRCGDTACGYINLGYSVGRWHSDDLELVDLAPAPVETPAQPPTSAKSH